MAGISGDGYTIQLGYGGDTLTLSRMGEDGPPPAEALRRACPLLRARALGLAASGEPKRFATNVTSIPPSIPEESVAAAPAVPVPCEALLYEDVLLVARDGDDVEPLFLTDFSNITFDDCAYTVRCPDWAGAVTVFSRLAGQTEEFVHELTTRRDALAREAGETLARWLPSLTVPARTALAALWLLAARGDRRLLENLSAGDHVTYQFQGDSHTTRLAGRLLCAPQFSGEALYLPLDQLTGEHADLAIAARDLGFLRHLRERFQGRLIYTTPQAWQAGLDG